VQAHFRAKASQAPLVGKHHIITYCYPILRLLSRLGTHGLPTECKINQAAGTANVRRGNTRADKLSRLSFPPGAVIAVLAYHDDVVIMCVTRKGATEPQLHQWPLLTGARPMDLST
jgi:hypothetical protein